MKRTLLAAVITSLIGGLITVASALPAQAETLASSKLDFQAGSPATSLSVQKPALGLVTTGGVCAHVYTLTLNYYAPTGDVQNLASPSTNVFLYRDGKLYAVLAGNDLGGAATYSVAGGHTYQAATTYNTYFGTSQEVRSTPVRIAGEKCAPSTPKVKAKVARTSATLSWGAPQVNPGGVITAGFVDLYTVKGGKLHKVCTVVLIRPYRGYAFTGLRAHTRYAAVVTLINTRGLTASSKKVYFTTQR